MSISDCTAVVAGGMVLLLSMGGCGVETGEDRGDTASTKLEQVMRSGQGRFDLTSPPSRDEVGLAAGSSHVAYEQPDQRPFEIRVALPDGAGLAFDARLVWFDSLGSPDPATGPPTTLDIHHYTTLAGARDHLLAAAEQFGFAPEAVDRWYAEASGPLPVAAPSTVRTPWLTATVGYLELQVRGGYSPPVDTPESDQTVVHYALRWGAGPASPPP